MTNSALTKFAFLLVVLPTACSVLVNADRSKVKDDLYQPTDAGSDASNASTDDAGDASDDADAADAEAAAGATGAAGAASEGGAAGAATGP